MAKKEPAPKKRLATPKRDTTDTESLVDPGYIVPKKAPSYRDFPVEDREHIDRSMADAGMKAYGHPIRMADSVASRVNAIQAAIGRLPAGSYAPEGYDWYTDHQSGYREVANRTGTRIGSIVDAAGVASVRNTPKQERIAVESAGHIAGNPDRMVKVTPGMVPHMGNPDIVAKKYRIGDLPDEDVAHLGYAESQAIRDKHGIPQNKPVPLAERHLSREVTGVTLNSAGRDIATKAVAVARGKTFDEVNTGSSAKTRNFSRAIQLTSSQEDAFNKEIFRRRAQAPTFVEGDGNGRTRTFHQSHLWSAAEETGFDPSKSDEAVEDYAMNHLSAKEAARQGTTGATSREAQNIVKAPKGKNTFDPSVESDEIRHAYNEEATRQAAEHFSFDDEHITPRAAQAVAWVEERRHVLGEDDEYNAAQKQLAKDAKKAAKEASKAPVAEVKAPPTPEERGQLTLF